MQKISKWKLISSILFVIIAVIYVTPNFISGSYDFLPKNRINLGLDLRGGSHLLIDIDFADYLEELNQSIADSLKKQLREKKIGYKNLAADQSEIKFTLRNPEDYPILKKIIRDIDSHLSSSLSIVGADNIVLLGYDEGAKKHLLDKVIDQSIEIIRVRIDSSGTKEPVIQRQGDRFILLQVPGEENPQQLKELLGKTAKLSFHLVDETANLEKAKNGILPADSKLLGHTGDTDGIVIKKKIIASGDQLNNAQASFNKDGVPVVHFAFNQPGAKKFAEVTRQNPGKRLAIVLDEKILSAPMINEPILSGEGVITGNFTVESATELALLLRAGALPAPLKIVEERTVGPNLGSDSIESGKNAAIVSFILVVIFMILSYGILGIIASIALIIALLYILALLSLLQVTLTMPGIAGIILTIGMAVDANVLIYERIREELAKGFSTPYAVKIGFETAFATITDSNVTTLIAASLLYIFGIGAIKGFAVTLTIGIVASMFTALVTTKVLIDLLLQYMPEKSIS